MKRENGILDTVEWEKLAKFGDWTLLIAVVWDLLQEYVWALATKVWARKRCAIL